MSQMRLVRSLALAGLVAAFAVGSAFAQGGGGGRGGRGGGRGFDPAAALQQREDGIKTAFGSTDDEWKAIQPLVHKVLAAEQETMMARFGGRGRRGGGGGNAGGAAATPANLSPVQQAHQDLQTVLDNKDSTAGDIAPKLKAYRDARDKAKVDLVAAQTALKQVLSARQEALLVSMGIMD